MKMQNLSYLKSTRLLHQTGLHDASGDGVWAGRQPAVHHCAALHGNRYEGILESKLDMKVYLNKRSKLFDAFLRL